MLTNLILKRTLIISKIIRLKAINLEEVTKLHSDSRFTINRYSMAPFLFKDFANLEDFYFLLKVHRVKQSIK